MMGPAHFSGGIGAESFGVDGFVGGSAFDAESFVAFSLAFLPGPAHIRPPEVAGGIGVAAALPFGFVGYNSFRIAIDVGLLLGGRIRIGSFW